MAEPRILPPDASQNRTPEPHLEEVVAMTLPSAARRWLPRLLGPIVLGIILLRLDLADIVQALERASTAVIALACVVVLPVFPLRSWRWRLLLESQGTKLGAIETLNAYAFSIVVGAATPGRIGELVKISYLRRRRVPTTVALLTVGVDRILDLFFVIFVGLAALAAFAGGRTRAVLLLALVATAVACAAALRYALSPHGRRTARRFLALILPERWSQQSLAALETLFARMTALPRSTLAAAGFLTALAWLATYLSLYLCAIALGLEIPFLDLCGVTAVSSLVSFLPISILGLGTRDATLIALLAPYGISATRAVALSALYLSIILWGVLVCSYSLMTPAASFQSTSVRDVRS